MNCFAIEGKVRAIEGEVRVGAAEESRQYILSKLGPDTKVTHEAPPCREFGGYALDPRSEGIDDKLKAATAIAVMDVQAVQKKQGGFIGWEKLRAIFAEKAAIFVRERDTCMYEQETCFGQRPSDEAHTSALAKMQEAVNDSLIWENLGIGTDVMADIFSTVRKLSIFRDHNERAAHEALDVGVMRIPDPADQHFRLWRFRVIVFRNTLSDDGLQGGEYGMHVNIQEQQYVLTGGFKQQCEENMGMHAKHMEHFAVIIQNISSFKIEGAVRPGLDADSRQYILSVLGPDTKVTFEAPPCHEFTGYVLDARSKKIDDKLKAATAIAIKRVQAVQEKEGGFISWNKLLEIFAEKAHVFAPEEVDRSLWRHQCMYEEKSFFGQRHEGEAHAKALETMEQVVDDPLIWENLKIDKDRVASIFSKVPEFAIVGKERVAHVALDVGVMRIPDPDHPHFRLWRFRVIVFRDTLSVVGLQGGEYGMHAEIREQQYVLTGDFKQQCEEHKDLLAKLLEHFSDILRVVV